MVSFTPDDSWLGDDDREADHHIDMGERLYSGTERLYSGRESPTKKCNPRGSAELRARMSASTTDSFDTAFQRPPPVAAVDKNTDDFFDT